MLNDARSDVIATYYNMYMTSLVVDIITSDVMCALQYLHRKKRITIACVISKHDVTNIIIARKFLSDTGGARA